MKILGVSEGFHDAAVALIEDGNILHASHSERYSGIKNDPNIHSAQNFDHDIYAYYEKNWLKNTRRVLFGQKKVPYYKCDWCLDQCSKKTFYHHQSHAAAGFYTAPFDDCNILVIDSIGEWDTISVWDNMRKIKSWKYPYSLGLFYSAVTQRVGLKPNEDVRQIQRKTTGQPKENYRQTTGKSFENQSKIRGTPKETQRKIQ